MDTLTLPTSTTPGELARRALPIIMRAAVLSSVLTLRERHHLRTHHARRPPGPVALPALAIGATALGALAIGAFSIGKLAIGKLALGRAELKELHIHSLQVDALMLPGEEGESTNLPM
ncbi:hypothetical protein P2318_05325 [Myxococcaceae bacterium GXIMD 01537]